MIGETRVLGYLDLEEIQLPSSSINPPPSLSISPPASRFNAEEPSSQLRTSHDEDHILWEGELKCGGAVSSSRKDIQRAMGQGEYRVAITLSREGRRYWADLWFLFLQHHVHAL
ncbi:hypothetical protein VNO77_41689 [Canavalia gladiata]|uniref:Uncharacterized protein n=1 Tax=Canavalia gladiata TaxID=3824 RepID=A0AAN9K2S7_CANGL